MAQLRGVILDVDGTLVDSNDAHAAAWVQALQEYGYSVPYEKVRQLIGMGGDNLLPAAAGLDKEQEPGKSIARRWSDLFQNDYLPHLRAFPKVRELLQRMTDSGLKLVAASSSKLDHVQALLKLAGAQDLVTGYTSSDDAENSKPDPDIVASALRKLGFTPDEVLMLGDSPYDVQAAGKIGVNVVAVRCGGFSDEDLRGALAIYDSPADLLLHYDESPFATSRRWRGVDEALATPDQAEGERDPGDKNTLNIGRTPGKAEGTRDAVEESLRRQEGQ
ncbi:MAG: HAD family hydrolase [Chloroflexi bacterium]|nr:HAD family hydrolase [Chloroflexota bacterium]